MPGSSWERWYCFPGEHELTLPASMLIDDVYRPALFTPSASAIAIPSGFSALSALPASSSSVLPTRLHSSLLEELLYTIGALGLEDLRTPSPLASNEANCGRQQCWTGRKHVDVSGLLNLSPVSKLISPQGHTSRKSFRPTCEVLSSDRFSCSSNMDKSWQPV